jgi:cytidylate kinase
MAQKTAAEHFAEAIARLNRRAHPPWSPGAEGPGEPVRRPVEAGARVTRPFSIAFSREVGTGGINVAREVGRRLHWPVYGNELMEDLARELKVDVSYVEDYDERRGSWLVDTIRSFASTASVSEVAYFRRLVRMLQALGESGECIIVGRGATFVLPPETTLRVRIVAARPDRIAFMAEDRGLSTAEAARFVDTHDQDRIRFIKDHYHKDPTDPLSFDLIINRSRFSLEETSDLVIEALRRMQSRKL